MSAYTITSALSLRLRRQQWAIQTEIGIKPMKAETPCAVKNLQPGAEPRICHAGCSVVESGQTPVAVKTEDAGVAVKSEEAPAVKPEPGSATPAAASGSGLAARAQQPPTTPASQLKSNGSMTASASPFV